MHRWASDWVGASGQDRPGWGVAGLRGRKAVSVDHGKSSSY